MRTGVCCSARTGASPPREIRFYPKGDFRNLGHLKNVITQFIPDRSLFQPARVTGLTRSELDCIARIPAHRPARAEKPMPAPAAGPS